MLNIKEVRLKYLEKQVAKQSKGIEEKEERYQSKIDEYKVNIDSVLQQLGTIGSIDTDKFKLFEIKVIMCRQNDLSYKCSQSCLNG